MVLRITPEKREERERVRRTLMRAAVKLGAEHGFSSLGLREVARAAAIAPTSFYRHFSDMPELGLALVEELVRPLLKQIASAARGAQPSELARRLIDGMFAAVDADAELVRFFVAERFGAFVPLRRAIARELELLGKLAERSLRRARADEGADARGDALIALMLDGLGRALDSTAARRANLREQLHASLSLVLRELGKESP